MRQVLRRTIVGAALGSMLLSGCSVTVTGVASPGAHVPTNVAPSDFQIVGAEDDPADVTARNALVDLNTFWTEAYPKAFGQPFQPLQGGYFSVDSKNIDESAYPPTGIGCRRDPAAPDSVADNAHYDPNCDLIAYDRALLADLAKQDGRALPAVVMAHEFGHAIQFRFGPNEQSIFLETQADCFAGAWTAWAAAGHAAHVRIRPPELDQILVGYVQLRDPVGTNPNESQAHGTFFDRVSGFYEGFTKGVDACRDDWGPNRVFTETGFSGPQDYRNQGNAPYDTAVDLVERSLPDLWQQAFDGVFHRDFAKPDVKSFDGDAPGCGNMDQQRQLGYCSSGNTVYFDEKDLTRPAYDAIGDFAVAEAIALPYGLAVRSQLKLSTDDQAATRSAVCLTGWYAAKVFNDESPVIQISPGDIDEAVVFLLKYGDDEHVFPHTGESGFQLLGTFRSGFLQGLPACDVGA